jgi:DMSO reductase anchor subunit
MLKSNYHLALTLAALVLVLGSGLIAGESHAAVPENASSQLEHITSAD